jgi:DNA topoisomerase-1
MGSANPSVANSSRHSAPTGGDGHEAVTQVTLLNRRFATKAHLHYVNDNDLTIRRDPWHKAFRYVTSSDRTISDKRVLARIEKLAIPPAWTDVRISPDPAGHIQAVGRDARGRKQYRYHERWNELRNENKFERMLEFGRVLPKIRRAVRRDLRQPELTQRKVLAAVVRLLELSAVRVGNEEYVKQNHSHGLTTLRNRHARVVGDNIKLRFRGKSGKERELDIRHHTLARVVRKCQQLPGQKLFEYADEKGVHPISSDDVNNYLTEITGRDFTAKDFRTWKATAVAMLALMSPEAREKVRQKHVKEAIARAAEHLGNTVSVCRKRYVHPAVLESYLNGATAALQNGSSNSHRGRNGLAPEEKAVLCVLRKAKTGVPDLSAWKHLPKRGS